MDHQGGEDALGSQFLSPRGWDSAGAAEGHNSAHCPQANGRYSPKDSWMPGFNLTKKGQGRTGVTSQHFTGTESTAQTSPTLEQLIITMTITTAALLSYIRK